MSELLRLRGVSLVVLWAFIAGCDFVEPDVAPSVMADARRIDLAFDHFGSMECLPDGTNFDPWAVRFAGYGCVRPETVQGQSWLALAPAAVDTPDMTRASLVTGPNHGRRFRLLTRLITDSQLRTGSEPNPWEAAWVVWDYADDAHFYYAILKPNGWEIGKRDPAYPGGQRFLATSTSPSFPIGQWNTVVVERTNRLKTNFYVDGVLLASFTDEERPYRGGRVGLYTEDAAVRVEHVALWG